jgi:hypothetical protein
MSLYTDSNTAIVISIGASVPSRDWQRLATKKARAAVEALGLEWLDARVVVELPEAGRCFHKATGALGLGAIG